MQGGRKSERESEKARKRERESEEPSRTQNELFTTTAALSIVPVFRCAEMSQFVKTTEAVLTIATPVTALAICRFSKWKEVPSEYL
eukprot:SAG11_NODE_1281_length_5311_cov_4.192441_3_plen_86_part_00